MPHPHYLPEGNDRTFSNEGQTTADSHERVQRSVRAKPKAGSGPDHLENSFYLSLGIFIDQDGSSWQVDNKNVIYST